MESDIVSIVIPVYNSEKFISECLDSIINQEYSKIDIIVVNDGSSDSSLSICEKYVQLDSRIRLFNQMNSGVSSARNKGLIEAIGKYVAFVDSDDTLEKKYITELLKGIKKNDVDLAICNYNIVNVSTHMIEHNSNEKSKLINMSDFFSNYWINYHLGYVNSPVNKLYKMDIIKNNNLLFPEDIVMGEDGYFNINYLHFCKEIYLVGSFLYNYKIHTSQSSKKIFENHFYMLKKIFDNLEQELVNYNLLQNSIYLSQHYLEYFNEIKPSISYIFNCKSLKFMEKRKKLKEICCDSRTVAMLEIINVERIKDKILIFMIKHRFF